MMPLLKKLGKLMSVRLLAIGLTFVQTIVMTRVFGSEVFGLLSFALSISAFAILILSAGLDQILMRDIARFGASIAPRTGRWTAIWRLVRYLVTPVTLIVSAGGALLMLTTDIGGPYQITLLGSFIILPAFLVRKYAEGISLGTKKVVRSIFGSQIVYPVLMILGGGVIWLGAVETSAAAITYTYVFAGLGSMMASLLLIRGALADMRRTSSDTSVEDGASPGTRAILMSGIHFSLVSLGFVLGQHIDVLLTGVLSGPGDVTLVRIASRVAEMAGLMRAIIMLQFKPLLAEAHGKSDTALLQAHVKSMVKMFVITGIPITVTLWIFAEQVMGVFGPEFVEGAWAMRIYVLGVLVTLILGPGDATLSFSAQEGVASRILMGSIAIQFVLDLVLIPNFGVMGCAYANLMAMCYLGLASRHMVIKKVGVDPSIFSVISWSRR
ncbi:oligosaccharide flippase family protein [Albirhodobacter sp. R86504]|uniref:oligosaccharide flippase family protein n=1 Tax=Albirhodobacter sp. R86504 TaxID=3093848 RepID=UPI003672D9F4